MVGGSVIGFFHSTCGRGEIAIKAKGTESKSAMLVLRPCKCWSQATNYFSRDYKHSLASVRPNTPPQLKFSSLRSIPLVLDAGLLNFLAVCKFNSARLKVLEGTDSRM